MDILEAMQQRHSVRAYTDKPIEGEVLAALEAEIAACNDEGGLRIQLVLEEPQAFGTGIFKYGQFKGVRNYLCFVGPDNADLGEKVGFYGERIILRAQQLELNSCWVALTFNKRKARYECAPGEKLALVAAIGYGETQGKARKSKSVADVSSAPADAPDWFAQGVAAALLAPTAVNQQKFRFEYLPAGDGTKPRVRATTSRGTQTDATSESRNATSSSPPARTTSTGRNRSAGPGFNANAPCSDSHEHGAPFWHGTDSGHALPRHAQKPGPPPRTPTAS